MIEMGIAVFNTNLVLVHEDVRQFTIKGHSDPHVWNDLFIDEFEFPLAPEHYNIAIHAGVLGANKLNGWKFRYQLTGTHRDRLSCSTLKLVFHVSPTTDLDSRHREVLKIIPN